jgi:hypothetical protein
MQQQHGYTILRSLVIALHILGQHTGLPFVPSVVPSVSAWPSRPRFTGFRPLMSTPPLYRLYVPNKDTISSATSSENSMQRGRKTRCTTYQEEPITDSQYVSAIIQAIRRTDSGFKTSTGSDVAPGEAKGGQEGDSTVPGESCRRQARHEHVAPTAN